MTKDDALTLISQYCRIMKDRNFKDETVTGLHDRWPDSGSENKAMRWLGFMQGALYSEGVFTLDELKQHSLHRRID